MLIAIFPHAPSLRSVRNPSTVSPSPPSSSTIHLEFVPPLVLDRTSTRYARPLRAHPLYYFLGSRRAPILNTTEYHSSLFLFPSRVLRDESPLPFPLHLTRPL